MLTQQTTALLEGDLERPATYRKAITNAKRDLEEAEARLTELDGSREEALLSGGDAQLEAIEENIQSERRTIERLRLLLPKLAAREEEAVKMERVGFLRGRLDAARQLETNARKIVDQYERAAEKLAERLDELRRINQEIEAARTALKGSAYLDACPAPVAPHLVSDKLPDRRGYGENGGVRLPAADQENGMHFGDDLVPETEAQREDRWRRERAERARAVSMNGGGAVIKSYDSDGNLTAVNGRAVRAGEREARPDLRRAATAKEPVVRRDVGVIPVFAPSS